MSPTFPAELLLRVEEASINASAPREQLWIDGWLVRFSAGKAKRARCIQAVAPGRLPLEQRFQRCLAVYAGAGLRPYVRITPFSQPSELDAWLAGGGLERIDETRVMVAALPSPPGLGEDAVHSDHAIRFQATAAADFAEWIGVQRGSTASERRAHAVRLQHAPVRHHATLVVDRSGTVVAGGQVAIEDELAGLYDVFTVADARNRGWAQRLCGHLLSQAASQGARIAYLQVEAVNDAARRLYSRLGFADAYAYHYRTPPAA
jgi:ribosomal protein S18 acetylase RimI-like enzyme